MYISSMRCVLVGGRVGDQLVRQRRDLCLCAATLSHLIRNNAGALFGALSGQLKGGFWVGSGWAVGGQDSRTWYVTVVMFTEGNGRRYSYPNLLGAWLLGLGCWETWDRRRARQSRATQFRNRNRKLVQGS